ncbi:MAG: T9SS C-terminal target domain-containing protein [Bacteroidetes bacterium]|nr:MAG: T9SS C-terminal target domain-containing protein [Bacteroidota bacterium]
MKSLLPILLLLCIPAGLSAQITLASVTFPTAGDTLRLATDNAPTGILALTPPGGNQTWDFSSLQASSTQSIVYQSAASGQYAASFPGAEIFSASVPGTEAYYNVTANKWEQLGYGGPDPYGIGVSAVFSYSPPLVEGRSPVNFFDINQQSVGILKGFAASEFAPAFLASLPFTPDSLRYRIAISRIDVVDAWGSVITPAGTYPVLRGKRTLYRNSRIDAKVPPLGWLDVTDVVFLAGVSALGVDTTVSYHFYSNTEKEPIAVVTLDHTQSFATQVVFKAPPAGVNGIDDRTLKPLLTLSPNPASGELFARFEGLRPGTYQLSLLDALGREVFAKPMQAGSVHTELLDVSRLPAGLYSLCVRDPQQGWVGSERLLKL